LAAIRKASDGAAPKRRPPAKSPEARERQLVAMSIDEAEYQIMNHKASSQVLVHYLKLGTTRNQLEEEKLRQENLLLQARVEHLAQGGRIEELYTNALKAFGGYRGDDQEENDEESFF
jgi:hypothetical protein